MFPRHRSAVISGLHGPTLPNALRQSAVSAWALWLAAAGGCASTTPNAGNNVYVVPDGSGGNVDIGGSDGASGSTDDTGTASGQDGSGSGGSDTGSSTGGGDTGGSTPKANFTGYASKELMLRIVGPSGRGHAVVSGSIVEVAGVLFGNADEITWSTDSGGAGSAHGSPFFQTDPITLVPGDNVLTVTAKNANSTVTDKLVVTYNPTFTFQDRLRAGPRVIKAGKATSINATIAIGKGTNVVGGSVKLFRVDDAGNTLTTFGVMQDSGDLAGQGDEIKGDGIYSRKININDSQAGTVKLRVSLQAQAGNQTITAYSDILTLDVVKEVTGAECSEVTQALSQAKGGADQAAIVATLKANPAVADAGGNPGGGVWVRFKSGLLGAVGVRKDGNRGGESSSDEPVVAQSGTDTNLALSTIQVQSKRAALLDPFGAEFGADEVAALGTALTKIACPAYTVDSAAGSKADLRWFRRLYDYGVVALASHGDALFGEMSAQDKASYDWRHMGNQEVVWTGHQVSCSYFGTSGAPQTNCSETKPCGPEAECVLNQSGGGGVCVDHLTADLRRGRLIIGADGTYGITPAFIKRHAEEPYPKSLIYVGACRSLWNGSLAGELFAAGAAAVAGYTGPVSNEFATKWGATFLLNVIEQKKLSGVAHVAIEDQANPGTGFSLVGAQNLDAFHSDILNPSWETGSIQGWIKKGDGRVVSRLGSTVPVAGKFMGIISTGLGYTAQTGEISQRFCVPAGKTKFSFWWKYYSEEFKEYCNSQYQDAFTARLEGKVGNSTVVDVKVLDLCDGGKQFKGLTPADVGFDQGGVFMTPWVEGTKDIAPFAGNGNTLLRFFTTDVGDSVFDTAVLIDKVEFL